MVVAQHIWRGAIVPVQDPAQTMLKRHTFRHPGSASRTTLQVFRHVQGRLTVGAGVQFPVLNRSRLYTVPLHDFILLPHLTLVSSVFAYASQDRVAPQAIEEVTFDAVHLGHVHKEVRALLGDVAWLHTAHKREASH